MLELAGNAWLAWLASALAVQVFHGEVPLLAAHILLLGAQLLAQHSVRECFNCFVGCAGVLSILKLAGVSMVS